MGKVCLLAIGVLLLGCGASDTSSSPNPFLQDQSNSGKEDTAYMNPDGIEVEVDLEADVEGLTRWNYKQAPAELGQFALTYLRKRGGVYLESLAEDASSESRPEWLVDGVWLAMDKISDVPLEKLRHFRLRAVNAVLLFEAAKGVKAGHLFATTVPLNPFDLMSEAGDTCADPDSHIGLSQSVYWYLWNPEKEGCKAKLQPMKVTLASRMAKSKTVYPEYDRLVADQKLTAVFIFGQIGDGEISDGDMGMRSFRQMADWLGEAGFSEVTPAPLGRRFSKTVAEVAVEIDLYSPREFSGLGDYGHFENFQKAISEHELVIYDGHSMLGASDFWARPTYPDFYQIFFYGGCLGYEYYVRPILAGKKGWANVDILSSVVEVSATANDFAAPALAKILWALENGYRASWRDILVTVRTAVGDSTFGVSGVRDNVFRP